MSASTMLLTLGQLIIGFLLLIWSADRLVVGAANIARNWGMNPLLIGLTIVSIGTSAPEIVIAIVAAMHQQTDLVVGNAIGSNLTNIGLGIGLIALIAPLKVRSSLLYQEYPILALVMGLLGILMLNGVISHSDGLILLGTCCLVIIWLVKQAKVQQHHAEMQQRFAEDVPQHISTTRAMCWLIIGMIILPISARILVLAAVTLGEYLGISQLVIGLTVIAIGTSLPEIAASLMGALRQEYDISIGNILGSNMMNIVLVLGLPATITPIPVPSIALYRDYTIMLGLTLLLFIASYSFRQYGRINRIEGGIILICYLTYLGILALQT